MDDKIGKWVGKLQERDTYLCNSAEVQRARLTGCACVRWETLTLRHSEFNSLLMLKFPAGSIRGTKSKLVPVKLKLDMRIIEDSLSQRCHGFCFRFRRRSGRKRRRQGQGHLYRMCWWQSAVKRNSEREDGIVLRYYWEFNNLDHKMYHVCSGCIYLSIYHASLRLWTHSQFHGSRFLRDLRDKDSCFGGLRFSMVSKCMIPRTTCANLSL